MAALRVAKTLDADALRRYIGSGIKPWRIASLYGCSESTVKKRLARFGISKSRTPAVQVVGARQQVAQAVPRAARSWFEV